jgi:hypothetical protein
MEVVTRVATVEPPARRYPIRHSIDSSLSEEADVDEPTTDRTLSDDDIETISPPLGSASTERPQDADGTDTRDGKDGDATDMRDGDSRDQDTQDSQDTDSKDMKDADGTDTRDTDGTDSRDTDGTDQRS